MNSHVWRLFLVMWFATYAASAQMLHPSIDKEGEPFSYFSKPTDVIGVMDGQEGTLITPEGYLCTGFGELMFFTGRPERPVSQRVKTLLHGYLPVVDYRWAAEGIAYDVCAFAATLDGLPESPMANFVRVTVRNTTSKPRRAFFSVATRYQNDANTDWGIGDNRFNRPVTANRIGGYEQAGVVFNPDWEYAFGDGWFMRDSLVFFLYDRSQDHTRRIVLATGYNEEPEFGAMRIPILPTTPVGVVRYAWTLQPGQSVSVDLKMPYVPVRPDDPFIAALHRASFDEQLRRTVQSWEYLFSGGLDIRTGEKKVDDSFKASFVYALIARNKHGDDYVQKVNEFQYDSFWLRDASYFVRMYDVSGYRTFARLVVDFFGNWQNADGNFLSQGGQYDGWGQAMWAYGRHVWMHRDTALARKVLPRVKRAVEWLTSARRGDSLNMMPVTTPGDNEQVSGHVTGHNFWALSGLKNAVRLASVAGDSSAAKLFQAEYDDYRTVLLDRLSSITASTNGYIPPSLDAVEGNDWGNMMSVYPEQILDPFDTMVTATLRETQRKYQEGIMTYEGGRYLHHYLTMKNSETELIRGEQRDVIGELYALLLHTSSTHAGFEFSIRPWGDRDFGMNLAPHGWFAAKYRTLLRNMFVREDEHDLHLISAVAPSWVADGRSVSVERAATDFGQIALTMKSGKGQFRLTINASWAAAPDRIIVHIPWFLKGVSVVADGAKASPRNGRLVLPVTTREVTVRWTGRQSEPGLSYDAAVKAYKAEYRKRYEAQLEGRE